jgi:hypothetical protein
LGRLNISPKHPFLIDERILHEQRDHFGELHRRVCDKIPELKFSVLPNVERVLAPGRTDDNLETTNCATCNPSIRPGRIRS